MNDYLSYAIDTLEIEQSHLKRLMRETEPQSTSRNFKHQINVLSKAIKVLKEYQVVFPNEDPDKEE
jgi:predicted glycosyltransferase